MISISAVLWADDKKNWFCSIVHFVSRFPRCFMNVCSPAGECVGCAYTYTMCAYVCHCPLVVHRFGIKSDWMVGDAGRTGRIWSVIYKAERYSRCTSATSRPEPPLSAICWFPISHCFHMTKNSTILPLQLHLARISAALMPRGPERISHSMLESVSV